MIFDVYHSAAGGFLHCWQNLPIAEYGHGVGIYGAHGGGDAFAITTVDISTWSVSGVPAGLTVTKVAARRLKISGTPTTAGSFAIGITVNGESITATLVVYAVTGKGGGPALSLNLGQTVDIDLEPYLSMLYSPTTTTVSSSFGFNSGYSAGYKLVTASDWEAFGEPVTLTVSGLPAGLSVVDNHIVGTLTTHGSGTYTVTATDRFGRTATFNPFPNHLSQLTIVE